MTAQDLSTTDVELIRAAADGVVSYLGGCFYMNDVEASALECHRFRDLIARGLLVRLGPIVEASDAAREIAAWR